MKFGSLSDNEQGNKKRTITKNSVILAADICTSITLCDLMTQALMEVRPDYFI